MVNLDIYSIICLFPDHLSGDIAIYDMTGRILKTAKFEPYGITAIQTGVITGAYIVKAANTNERVSKRIILGN